MKVSECIANAIVGLVNRRLGESHTGVGEAEVDIAVAVKDAE